MNKLNNINSKNNTSNKKMNKVAPKKKSMLKEILSLLLVLTVIFIGGSYIYFYKLPVKHSYQANADTLYGAGLPSIPNLNYDPNIINILLLGNSVGRNSSNAGASLTDSMMLASIDTKTGNASMISIPRDLYIQMPLTGQFQKINAAYEEGEKVQKGDGLAYAKWEISKVTGVYINYAVLVNLNSFQELVDDIGGIDIYRSAPFNENIQWHNNPIFASTNGDFYVPAGWSHLDGTTAMYYVRSRETTSDFDRASRQQQVILAIKDKLMSEGIFYNIPKMEQIYSVIQNNVQTDMNLNDIINLITVAKRINYSTIKNVIFSVGKNEPFYQTSLNDGTYIILPNNNSFQDSWDMITNIDNSLKTISTTATVTGSSTQSATN